MSLVPVTEQGRDDAGVGGSKDVGSKAQCLEQIVDAREGCSERNYPAHCAQELYHRTEI